MALDERKVVEAFQKVKEEMTDHLDAINESTNEINSVQDQLYHVEKMLQKLHERLDDMEGRIADLAGEVAEDYRQIVLNTKEKEIFLLLYSRTGDLMGYRDIAKHLGYTDQIVRRHIQGMIDKGIPIVKKYFDSKVYLVLDADFRNLQAKNNLISL